MWTNAKCDGRPAECRWRPLFNAAVWLTPTTQVNHKKIPPTTFVDITAMHGNFCTKFYTIVKRSNIHFITKFY